MELPTLVRSGTATLNFTRLDEAGLPRITTAELSVEDDTSVKFSVLLTAQGYLWDLAPGGLSGFATVTAAEAIQDVDVAYGGTLRVEVRSEAESTCIQLAHAWWRQAPSADGLGGVAGIQAWNPIDAGGPDLFETRVPAGPIVVRVDADGHLSAVRQVTVPGGSSPRLSVKLVPTASMRVRVMNGRGAVHATVRLTADYGQEHGAETEDGVAEFSDLRPATYTVSVVPFTGSSGPHVRRVVLSPGRREDLNIETAAEPK
jgi:hypothetical protein